MKSILAGFGVGSNEMGKLPSERVLQTYRRIRPSSSLAPRQRDFMMSACMFQEGVSTCPN